MKSIWKESNLIEKIYVILLNGLIISMWILFYIDNIIPSLDLGQLLILGYITFACLVADGIMYYNIRSRIPKTGQYYFNKLTKDVQDKFLVNLKNDDTLVDTHMKTAFESKRKFFSTAFTWADTPEGFKFWDNIADS